MGDKNSRPHMVPAAVVVEFLKKSLPFHSLSEEVLRELAGRCQIDFFPQGTLLFQQGVSEVHYLYLIQKGGVKSYLKDEEDRVTLTDFRGEGECFGSLPLIQGGPANLNIEMVDDTFCYLLPKEDFLALLQSNPKVAEYFLRNISGKLVRNVYADLRQQRLAPRGEGALYLFSAPVGEIAKGQLYTIEGEKTVRQAAATMTENGVGSLLVRDPAGEIVGIITDKDLRTKVVAAGLDYGAPVRAIMSAPVRTISSQAVGFDALLAMMSQGIHHLAIEREGVMRQMITTHDIMVLQGTSPLYLLREINATRRIDGLYPLAQKIPAMVRNLVEEGAKANNITRMITVLNDRILDRLLSLLLEELGPPPVEFSWLLLGSEGRREQTFKTDQDNAIIYRPPPPALAVDTDYYFKLLSAQAIAHLVQCGYPLCPGEVMASNPLWRQPLPVWQGYFQRWCREPKPLEILNSTVFFDFRGGFGQPGLAEELRNGLTAKVKEEGLFLLHLARASLATRPPLTFFRNFIVEKDGAHKNRLDFKGGGLVFFVDFARLLALKYGIKETNTLGRLLGLKERRLLSGELHAEVVEAYDFLMHIRLLHQLRGIDEGRGPDNYIDPGELSDLERQTLKEAFAVITRMQEFVRQLFQLRD